MSTEAQLEVKARETVARIEKEKHGEYTQAHSR